MRKRGVLFGVCIAVLFFAFTVSAEDYKKQTEKKKASNVNVQRPEGEKIETKGSLSYTEGFKTYTTRRFREVENRISKVDANEQSLRKEVERLKGELSQLQKKVEELNAEKAESSGVLSK